jgi:pyruvate/2-oxoglutarate dehydrogenase complex dihydrolipoamide acyltransferase (E2) component
VEAMKMEHTVTAPLDGVVNELTAKAGQQVRMDEALAVIGSNAPLTANGSNAQKATIEGAESANEPGGAASPEGESNGS